MVADELRNEMGARMTTVKSSVVGAMILLTAFIVAGCENQSARSSDEGALSQDLGARPLAPLSDRDAEVIRLVLEEDPGEQGDRIYFLTTTPMDKWGEHGTWTDLPQSFFDSIAGLPIKYRPASEAYLKNGSVLERGTDAKSWMQWVTIKRWISDCEVEVEAGVWCCPLGGGASTVIYEKIDGKWRIKSLGESWVS